MKCNYERLQRIKMSTKKVKLLAKTTKNLRTNAVNKDSEDENDIIDGEGSFDEEENYDEDEYNNDDLTESDS